MTATAELAPDGAAQLAELIAALPDDVADLLEDPIVDPCTSCGWPCSNTRKGRPEGVRRRQGRGRCESCYRQDRPILVEPRRRLGGPPREAVRRIVPTLAEGVWKRQAACRGVMASGFLLPDGRGPRNVPVATVALARRYCAACPVLAECDDYATRHEYLGLWGGRWRTEQGPRDIPLRSLPKGTKYR